MKKTYIEPKMDCVILKSVNLLTLSGDGLQMQINNSEAEEGVSGDSRGFGFFGDEE